MHSKTPGNAWNWIVPNPICTVFSYTNGQIAYVVWMCSTKELFILWMGWDGRVQDFNMLLKTMCTLEHMNCFWNFPLIFTDGDWPKLTETEESETSGEDHCVMFAMCWAGLWPYDVVMGFWAGQSFVCSDKILPEHITSFPLQDLCTTGSLCLEYSAGSLQGWLLLDCSSSGRPFLPVYTE